MIGLQVDFQAKKSCDSEQFSDDEKKCKKFRCIFADVKELRTIARKYSSLSKSNGDLFRTPERGFATVFAHSGRLERSFLTFMYNPKDRIEILRQFLVYSGTSE